MMNTMTSTLILAYAETSTAMLLLQYSYLAFIQSSNHQLLLSGICQMYRNRIAIRFHRMYRHRTDDFHHDADLFFYLSFY